MIELDCKFITRQTDLEVPTYDLDVLDELIGVEYKGYDFETTDIDPIKLHPILLGIIGNGQKYVIDFTTYKPKDVGKAISKINDGTWIAHNAQFDAGILKQHLDVDIDEMTHWCTMVASQVLYNGSELEASLKALVEFHFKHIMFKDVREGFINRSLLEPIKLEEIQYLIGDLEWLPQLQERQFDLLNAKDMEKLLVEIENPLIPVLVNMRLNGMSLNKEKWLKNADRFEKEEADAEQEVKDTVYKISERVDISQIVIPKAKRDKHANNFSLFSNEEMYSKRAVTNKFNPGSAQQVQNIAAKLGVKLESTNEESIQKQLLVIEDELTRDFFNGLLKHRTASKLVSTYGRNFLKWIHPVTGRLHTELNQAFTDTGRLNSKKPNLQNIVAEEDIRSCFVADNEDFVILTCDFEGQELRIATAYSRDRLLLANFKEGLDLHSHLAQESFRRVRGIPDFIVSKKVNGDLRDLHKRCLFGHIYGAKPARQAQVLNITKNKARLVTAWLEEAMPELATYQQMVKRKAVEDKVIYDGSHYNRRKLFNWRVMNRQDTHSIESQGANFPIQATAATMSKEAMIKVHRYLRETGLAKRGARILLAVHDELVIQLHKLDAATHAPIIKKIMEDVGTSYLRGVLEMKSSMSIEPYWKK
jgi:DNA polymerase I